jgi:tight adherence protein B
MSLTYALFVILGFLAVVLLLEGLSMLWTDTQSPEVKRIQRRLRVMAVGAQSEDESPLLKQRLLSDTPALQRLLLQLPHIQQVDRLLVQAGSSQSVAQLLMVCLLAAAGGILFAVLLLRWPWPGGVLLGAALAVLPVLRLTWQRSRRLHQIGAQLPDALDLISRAMRAGHGFSAALAMVGNQAQDPIAGEFKTTFDEINFGISTQNALINLAKRAPIPDLRYFVLAVVIQLETGGNLAELLSMLANLIRERFKLFGKIRVLATEGKLSAYILTALPFFLAGALQAINPGHLDILFTDPTGIRLVITTLVMMVLGAILMWRIIDIRV